MGVDFEPGLVYGVAETDSSKVIDNEFLESHGLTLAPQSLRNGYGLDFVYGVEVPLEAVRGSDAGASGVVSPEMEETMDEFLDVLKKKGVGLGNAKPELFYVVTGDFDYGQEVYLGEQIDEDEEED